mmetsp:Transcript_14890/g.31228  ORF Transcript_14890/g.31228 Transcript_14890/m.31228 type:complete len:858 (-) Transcript_14890:427-3000(-)|eukprot:CAMPEP_0182537838 /NCGR_PEP_ID=MMETSP1323-20130603/22659_1 /TAXON_ID=236787 /ORGANISM="Florenciella parvula, Strain RCC1693" /LENGTH=857 /DNA_ID=CAMNT_0024748261 /DNA_START=46 /DNA_END=2619 /DNA_ORIENTATION=+
MAVVGIDFGNLNCVIAQAGRGGVDVLLNGASKRQNACAVSFQGKQRFMGDEASAIARSNYRNTPVNMKRLIGRKFSEDEVQQEIAEMGVNCVEMPDTGYVGMMVNYNDEDIAMSMEQCCAMMLTKCMGIAEASAGAKVMDAVVSVPGYWSDAQRQSMIHACNIAGLNCLRLMHENTATALAFGIFKSAKGLFDAETESNVMFLDLGNAHFTASCVAFQTGKLAVKSAAYDRNLGGRAFDECIAKWISAEFKAKHNLDAWENPKARMKLLAAAEKAKKTLSPKGVTEAPVNVECLMNDLDFNCKLTLEKLMEMAEPLLARLERPIREALATAGLAPGDLASVEIVGGSTRLEFVKERMATLLETDKEAINMGLSTTMNADESVCRGCALQAAMLSTRFKVKEFNIYEAVSYPVKLSWDPVDNMVTEDEKEGDAEEEGDKKEGEDAAAEAGANELVIFKKNESTPLIRRVTFKRREPFTVTATYDEAAMPELPPGTDPVIGTFTVNPTPKDDVVPKIRVNIMHDLHGILKCNSAQMMEEIKDEPKEGEDAKADEGKEGDQAASPAEGKEGEGEEPPRKKRYRKVALAVDWPTPGLAESALQSAIDKEAKMQDQDLLIEQTNNARNDVESYIYAMRDKVIDSLRPYCTDAEKEAFEAALTAAEDWLYYGDGYDALKSVYEDKLQSLKSMGSPMERRQVELQTREATANNLKKSIADYKAFVSSADEKYAHITDVERDVVRKACADEESWLYDQMDAQGKLAANVDPILTCNIISQHQRELQDKCRPIMTKPKPQAPKPKPEEKDGEAKDGAAPAADADAAKEGASAEAPPPAADGDAAGAEGKEDAVEDPMETEDAKQID